VGPDPQTKEGGLTIQGNLIIESLTMLAGAEADKVLTTNASGVASWQEAAGGWDGVLPNYTTAQRNALSLADGLIVYNTTENAVQICVSGAWKNVGAKSSLGVLCSLDGDCDSTHCADGVCCDTTCDGNCNRCNIAGSIGTCIDVPSDCTGNCVVCSSGNCIANVGLCTGNCDQCTGSGTAYSCAANVALCTTACLSICSGSDTEFNCSASPIGSSCGGGKIAYIDGTGSHGLIAALSDQAYSPTLVWGCAGTVISGADGTAIGTGLQNTIDIMAGCSTPAIAARECRGVTINGYSDWHLPSLAELYQVCNNKIALGFTYEGYYYWTSSEVSATNAWAIQMGGCPAWRYYDSSLNKGSTSFYIRCVRSF